MIAYHGSDTKHIKNLSSEFSDEENFEGKAIYLSLSKITATKYVVSSGSVYTVKVDDSAKILSLVSSEDVLNFLNSLLSSFGIDIFNTEHKSQYSYHVLDHRGKNGVWCLDEDTLDLLKYEPLYKEKITNDFTLKFKKDFNQKLSLYDGFLINDRTENSQMLIIKNSNVCTILKEEEIN